MLKEPPFWKIGRPLRRPFSVRATIFTYALILLCMLGITGFTVYTKGSVVDCKDVMYKSTDPEIKSVSNRCKPTGLYPGQTISQPNYTFTYEAVALGNLTRPYALEKCDLCNSSWISSFHFPSSNPVITFDMTFICTTNFTTNDGDNVTTYAGIPIYSNTAVLGIKSVKGLPDDPTEFWKTFRRVQTDLRGAGIVCENAPLTGFRVFGDPAINITLSWISDNNRGAICYATESDPWPVLDSEVIDFYNKTIELAREDLISSFPLPNIIFNCPYCAKKIVPPSQLLWYIVVCVGSTWSMILLISTTIVRRVSNPYDRSYDAVWVEAVQMAQSNPNTPGMGGSKPYHRGHEDESAQHLLPTSSPQHMRVDKTTRK